ncbi:MAG: helix-turn-helix transcriptional regulator, partial [Pseudomonadota bacterium]
MPKLETKAIIDRLTSRLTAEMQKRSWKASPLSKAAGLNESAVRDILRGRSQNPGIVTISRIASLLEVRPGALFEDTGVLERLGFVGEGGDVSITSTIVIKEAAASWGGPARGAAARRRAARRAAAEEAAEKPTPEQALELLRENSGLFLLEVRTSALEPYTFQGDNLI